MSPPRGAGAGAAVLPPGGQGAPPRAGTAEGCGGGERRRGGLPAALRMRPLPAGRGREAAAAAEKRDEAAGAAAGPGAAGRCGSAVPGTAAPRPARPRHPAPRQVRPAAGGERGPPRDTLRRRPPLLTDDPRPFIRASPGRGRGAQGQGQPLGAGPGGGTSLWAGRDPRAGPCPGWGGTGTPVWGQGLGGDDDDRASVWAPAGLS